MDAFLNGSGLVFSLSGDSQITFSLTIPSSVQTDIYTGETVVNPDFVGKVLNTKRKLVTSDISVNPIQVEEVSNTSGGVTVYIGGII